MLAQFRLAAGVRLLVWASNSVGQAFQPADNFLATLTPAQRSAVEEFIHKNEHPSGELRMLTEPAGIRVNPSATLHRLFPSFQFVLVPWKFDLDPNAKGRYSIPGPGAVFDVLAIRQDGEEQYTFHGSGNHEEFASFIRAQGVIVRDQEVAEDMAGALAEIYSGYSVSAIPGKALKHAPGEWYFFYTEMPFRPVSSYEEERDASYYRLRVGNSGLVLDGISVNQVLERRKIRGSAAYE
jgi:hypothetical protein